MRVDNEYFSEEREAELVQSFIDRILAGGKTPPAGCLGVPIDEELLALRSAVTAGADTQPAVDAIWARLANGPEYPDGL